MNLIFICGKNEFLRVRNSPQPKQSGQRQNQDDQGDDRVKTVTFLKREQKHRCDNAEDGREDQQIYSGFDNSLAVAVADEVPDHAGVIIETVGFDAVEGDGAVGKGDENSDEHDEAGGDDADAQNPGGDIGDAGLVSRR